MVLLLRPEDHAGLLTMEEAIDAVEAGFREWAANDGVNAPRRRIHAPSGVRVSVHQGAVPGLGVTGLMTHCERVRILPDDHQRYSSRGRPVQVLYDAETGELACLIVGEPQVRELPESAVSGVRTAANSAVGTKYLARPDATRLGIFGSMGQARQHLVAFCAIRPIREVKVFSPNPEHRRRFAEEMTGRLDITVRAVDRPEEAIRGMDIILVATNSNVPVFDGSLLEPGQHVTSIVASNIGLLRGGFVRQKRRELDDATFRRAEVIVVNSRAQAIQDEQADLFDRVQAGLLRWEQIWELGEVLTGRVPGRTSPEQITLFKNNAGQGVSDVALGGRILAAARAKGVGVPLLIDGAEHRETIP